MNTPSSVTVAGATRRDVLLVDVVATVAAGLAAAATSAQGAGTTSPLSRKEPTP
jgi:hypothetical protein